MTILAIVVLIPAIVIVESLRAMHAPQIPRARAKRICRVRP